MLQTKKSGPSPDRSAAPYPAARVHGGERTGAIRAAFADLDLDNPANAFVYGLALGQAMERERQDAHDDAVHRAGVRAAIAEIDRADRRRKADRPGPRPTDRPERHLRLVSAVEATYAEITKAEETARKSKAPATPPQATSPETDKTDATVADLRQSPKKAVARGKP